MTQDASCLFCKIGEGSIPAKKIAESSDFYCIADIRPQAKKHLLVIPKKHVSSLATAFEDGADGSVLIGQLFTFGNEVAKQEGLLPGGFRAVINTGKDGGQTVLHLHLHLLGGESLHESMN